MPSEKEIENMYMKYYSEENFKREALGWDLVEMYYDHTQES